MTAGRGREGVVPSFHNPITREGVRQSISPFLKPCAEHESFLWFLKLQELYSVLTVPITKCLKNSLSLHTPRGKLRPRRDCREVRHLEMLSAPVEVWSLRFVVGQRDKQQLIPSPN